MPLTDDLGAGLAGEELLEFVAGKANGKLTENFQRIERWEEEMGTRGIFEFVL